MKPEMPDRKRTIVICSTIDKTTKDKLKTIARAHGFNVIGKYLDFHATKTFNELPEYFRSSNL